jgi:PAS domain S-box-containing protein
METKKSFDAQAIQGRMSNPLDFDSPEKKYEKLVSSFESLMAALPDIVYVLDKNGRFAYLNDTVRQIGYEPRELVGRHFTEILHPEDRSKVSREDVVAKIRTDGKGFPEKAPKLFDERRSGSRMTRGLEVRILNGTSGETVYCSVNAYGEPVTDPTLYYLFNCEGSVTMGVIHDVSIAHLYRTSLEENLAAKELLLREIHHRVRDNLQLVASMAHLTEMGTSDGDTKRALVDLVGQIKSIAMVHEALYLSENLEGVNSELFFQKLARLMVESFGHIGSPVSLTVQAERLLLPASLLSPLASIANELVLSAFYYAFPEARSGSIVLSFSREGEYAVLSVKDDGVPATEARLKGQSFEIVAALAKQLDAVVDLCEDGGTRVALSIPCSRL